MSTPTPTTAAEARDIKNAAEAARLAMYDRMALDESEGRGPTLGEILAEKWHDANGAETPECCES